MNTIFGFTRLASIAFALVICSNGCDDFGMPPSPPVQTEVEGALYDVAGMAGKLGSSGNGGPALDARLYWPTDVFLYDVTGDLYITDWNNHVYRSVSPDGIISLRFGSGIHGDDFDGDVRQINLNHPGAMAVGPDGNFYLAVWHNWKIKIVDKNTLYAVSIVGTDAGFSGDGGPANIAQIFLPVDIVFDPAGNMYIGDQGNERIRRVTPEGTINTFAGRQAQGWRDGYGLLAQFAFSQGNDAFPGGKLAIDAAGENLYVADQLNNRIRKINIADQWVSTVAGSGTPGYSGDGGPAIDAELNYPCDVVCAPNGDIYVADTRNNVVRRIDPDGIITTVVGTGVAGVSPNGTSAEKAMLNYVSGLCFDGKTNTLYLADTYNSQIKKVRFKTTEGDQ
jgi:hypothetical protein